MREAWYHPSGNGAPVLLLLFDWLMRGKRTIKGILSLLKNGETGSWMLQTTVMTVSIELINSYVTKNIPLIISTMQET